MWTTTGTRSSSAGSVALLAAALSRMGLWQELSGCAGVAGLRSYARGGGTVDGPVVCIATSSGFKDHGVGEFRIRETASSWDDVEAALALRSVP